MGYLYYPIVKFLEKIDESVKLIEKYTGWLRRREKDSEDIAYLVEILDNFTKEVDSWFRELNKTEPEEQRQVLIDFVNEDVIMKNLGYEIGNGLEKEFRKIQKDIENSGDFTRIDAITLIGNISDIVLELREFNKNYYSLPDVW